MGFKNMPRMTPKYGPQGPQIWVQKLAPKMAPQSWGGLWPPHPKEGGRGLRPRPPSVGYQHCGAIFGANFRPQIWGPWGPYLGVIRGMFLKPMGADLGVIFCMVFEARGRRPQQKKGGETYEGFA